MSQLSKSIDQILTKTFDPQHQEILDISGGCGTSYEIRLVSTKFCGLGLLKRHRMVNDALGKEIISHLHALTLVSIHFL